MTNNSATNAEFPARRRRRPILERIEERTLLSTIQVTSTSDRAFTADNVLTLRDAIQLVDGELTVGQLSAAQQSLVTGTPDQTGVTDTIDFAIPGSGPFTISPTSPLPALTHPVVIDGYSQTGAAANTQADSDNAVIQIVLSGAMTTGDGLSIGASGCTIEGLAIEQFSGNGIQITSTGTDALIAGNFIGTDVTGKKALPNSEDGVGVAASKVTIGGTATGARNVVSGNLASGVYISQGSLDFVEGNFIGTDVMGKTAIPNGGDGVSVNGGKSDRIGGLTGSGTQRAGNIISGNHGDGIFIGGGALDITVEANFIGTDPGSDAIGNGNAGVRVFQSTLDSIGGTAAGAGNVIDSNSGDGISLTNADGTQVLDNFLGTLVSGQLGAYIPFGNPLENQADGISVLDASDTSQSPYKISGNVLGYCGGVGIAVTGVPEAQICDNMIGTDSTGEQPGAIGSDGIAVVDSKLLPSGYFSPVANVSIVGNVVSSCNGDGISAISSSVAMEGNEIGTDKKGNGTEFNANLSNYGDGIDVLASGVTIGGAVAADSNLVSNNSGDGISISAFSTALVEGNEIGTNIKGTGPFPNLSDGIVVFGLAQATIGGSVNGAGNVISSNGGDGISVVGPNTIGGTNGGTLVATALVVANVICSNGVSGISVTNWDSISISGNDIGTNKNGLTKLGNANDGILLQNSESSSIGAGNSIMGNNGYGVLILGSQSSQNVIMGNQIGTAGNPNQLDGVLIEQQASGNIVGPSNTISSNRSSGVELSGTETSNNVIEGNAIQGQNIGVLIDEGATSNTVGSTVEGGGNTISSNSLAGVEIAGVSGAGTANNSVIGNRIGTDASGQTPQGNAIGVLIFSSASNSVGSTAMGAGNTIAGSSTAGVEIIGTNAKSNTVEGNLIGAPTQSAAFENQPPDPTAPWIQAVGVLITDAAGNSVGGTVSGSANSIWGNDTGVEIAGYDSSLLNAFNTVVGNTIGAKTTSNVLGIWVDNVPYTHIQDNTIPGNTEAGVYINGADATDNEVQNNTIGPGNLGFPSFDSVSENPFPIGVYIDGSSENTIGGSASARNTIQGNGAGVYVLGNDGSATDNDIGGNRIENNSLYGVILVNAPHNNVPPDSGTSSGLSANTYSRDLIANFREYSGSVPITPRSSSGQGSGAKAKKPAHHSHHAAHSSPRRTASHASETVHGHSVPAGPMRKSRSRVAK
jgi:parallel beta-helix repeat protein